jgi:3-methyladenine DNA glycosylase AlkD
MKARKSSPMTTDLARDIRQAIEGAAGGVQPEPETRYHKGDVYFFYGLRMPEFRKIMKAFHPRLLTLSLVERLQLAEDMMAEHIGELNYAGIYVLSLSVDDLSPEHFGYLDRLIDDFRGWSDVDYFCIDVMQPLLWRYPQETIALHEAWAGDANKWRRRSSVVTFTRKVGESGQFTDQVLALCDKLIWAPEDLVQKGVGWALKDNLRGAPDKVVPYVKELRRMGVPSNITLYAIRDLKGEERQAVLAVKKQKKVG